MLMHEATYHTCSRPDLADPGPDDILPYLLRCSTCSLFRGCSAKDISNAVLFLASDESRYMADRSPLTQEACSSSHSATTLGTHCPPIAFMYPEIDWEK